MSHKRQNPFDPEVVAEIRKQCIAAMEAEEAVMPLSIIQRIERLERAVWFHDLQRDDDIARLYGFRPEHEMACAEEYLQAFNPRE